MNKHRLIATLLAAAAVSGAAAGTASANSVAYIKDGNVWLTPGGVSREFQVANTGGYTAVSQADDGTLLATAGGELRRLDARRVLVHLTFTRAARRRFRHSKHLTLSLTVAQGSQHVTGRLRLTR